MPDEVYYQYNPWWEEEMDLEGIVPRSQYLSRMEKVFSGKSIVILTGLRRVGKTTLLKLFIRDLIRKDIPARHIFYISLDDYSLEKKSIIDIVAEYRKIQKLRIYEKVYLFLDEIAYKDQFHRQLKNLYDQQNVKIYASSSSSSVLKDKKAYLTGREMVLEVLPLNFEEFCAFRKLEMKKREDYLKESFFEEYLRIGGIPEYVLSQNREYLTTLVDDVIYKDIVAFHGIKNPQGIKDLFALLMERVGKQVSINKLANILKMSPDTATRYLRMFAETYLIYLMPRHGKLNERILSPKKNYAADLGIRNLLTGFRDKGALFENYVYLTIKSLDPGYIYQNGIELDFFTQDKMLIEAKYGSELTDKQKELFEKTKAKKKLIVETIHDIESLKALMIE
ncbi:MAG: ATP-binding protein [Syntrophales bacterium]